MRRRALLRAAALAGAAGIAGCTSDGPNAGGGGGGPNDQSPTESPTGSPTDSPTDEPTESPTEESPTPTPMGNGLVGESFAVTDRGCGQGENTVTVTFDDDFVRLEGVIPGDDACYTADQASVVYDSAADRLSVNIRSYRPEDAGACADCIIDISYEARYTFEDETPKEVAVSHNGREIARASHGSARATARGTERATSE